MASGRFIHISFSFDRSDGRIIPTGELTKTFSLALDWLNYGENWVLYTTTDMDTWRDRIRNLPGIKATDAFFLIEFTKPYSGYMYDVAWTWLGKNRTNIDSKK